MSRQEWSTPPAFISWVQRVVLPRYGFKDFDLDVCAHDFNKKAPFYIGPPGENQGDGWIGENAFATPWMGKCCWCNPGFTGIDAWFRRAHEQCQQWGNIVLVMSHAQSSAQWHRKAWNMATERIDINPRINYLPPPGVEASSNNKDSHLWVITPSGGPCQVWYPEPWRPYGKK